MEENTDSKKKRNRFYSLLAVIMVVVILLVSGEIYLRLFKSPHIVPRYIESSHYGIRKNMANVRGKMITSMYRHKFNTNSQGFRGTREYTFIKPSDTYRIIVLGDSIAFGHGVEDHETFSAILEESLEQKQPAEVINMGVSGFGTAEELIQLKNIGFKYDPDLVILAYYPNDPYNNVISKLFKIENGNLIQDRTSYIPALAIRDHLSKIPGYSYLSQNSHLMNFIRFQISHVVIRRLASKHEISISKPKALNNKATDLTAALLNELIVELGRHNIPLIIVNVPMFSKEGSDNFPEAAIIFNNNTYLVDVQEQIYLDYPGDKCYGDGHIRPVAHRMIGKWLENFIYDQDLI